MMLKLWIDDIRPAPNGFLHCKTVDEVKSMVRSYERQHNYDTILLDLDHDAGEYANPHDYIEILNWLEREGIVDQGYFFRIHSQNVVGRQNMEAIIRHNKWRFAL